MFNIFIAKTHNENTWSLKQADIYIKSPKITVKCLYRV